jgi:hypothetical protein
MGQRESGPFRLELDWVRAVNIAQRTETRYSFEKYNPVSEQKVQKLQEDALMEKIETERLAQIKRDEEEKKKR